MHGMILAAGYGTRLKPLTDTYPKPLIPVGPYKLIEFSIYLLKKHGITSIHVNVHYKGKQIIEYLGDGLKYGVSLTYSIEEEILGTGGGIRRVMSQIPETSLLIINSDIVTDIDLKTLIQSHQKSQLEATMVLRKMPEGESLTPILINQNTIKAINPEHTLLDKDKNHYHYTGIQILEPGFAAIFPEGASCLIKNGYQKWLGLQKKIHVFIHHGYWNDLGTPDRYHEVQKEYAEQKLNFSFLPC